MGDILLVSFNEIHDYSSKNKKKGRRQFNALHSIEVDSQVHDEDSVMKGDHPLRPIIDGISYIQ